MGYNSNCLDELKNTCVFDKTLLTPSYLSFRPISVVSNGLDIYAIFLCPSCFKWLPNNLPHLKLLSSMESQSRFFCLSPIIMHGICLESAFHSSTNFGGYRRMTPHGFNSFKLERACFSRSSFRNVEIVKICVFVLLACSMILETTIE